MYLELWSSGTMLLVKWVSKFQKNLLPPPSGYKILLKEYHNTVSCENFIHHRALIYYQFHTHLLPQ